MILHPGCNAQEPDTAVIRVETRMHSPQKAILLSAILPGLGQVYNKKYWKVPIIYGAGTTFVFFTLRWQNKFQKFKDALYEYEDSKDDPIWIDGRKFDYDILPRARDGYRRWRDLCIAGTAAVYFLNIIDAMIDAHFVYYDISDDLSLRINPVMMDDPAPVTAFGLSIHLCF